MLRDYYKNVRKCIDEYNRITDKIKNKSELTTFEEDVFMENHYDELVKALIEDIHDDLFLVKLIDALRKTDVYKSQTQRDKWGFLCSQEQE